MPRVIDFQTGYLSGVGNSSTLWWYSAAAMYSCQIGTANVAPCNGLAVHVEHRDLSLRIAHPDDRGELTRVAVEPRVAWFSVVPVLPAAGWMPSPEPAPVP